MKIARYRDRLNPRYLHARCDEGFCEGDVGREAMGKPAAQDTTGLPVITTNNLPAEPTNTSGQASAGYRLQTSPEAATCSHTLV